MFESEKSLLKAVVIATGRELLTGRVRDTNSGWLCSHLFDIGIKVFRTVVVDDDHDEIGVQVKRAISDGAEVIVTTGGLGPTPDDMTIRCVADAVGTPISRSIEAMEMIRERYQALVDSGRLTDPEINAERAKMADLPETARILSNSVGTAPGVDWYASGTRIFCLPGPPREMVPMAEQWVLPAISGMVHGTIRRLTVEIDLYDESLVAATIRRIQDSFRTVHFKPDPGVFDGRRVMRVHLESAGSDAGSVDSRLMEAAAALGGRPV